MDTSGNWSFITIRFHETDIKIFDHFVKCLFTPYILTNELYIIGIEFPELSARHLHAVIKNTTSKENSKVLQKITNLCTGKKNQLNNTILKNAIDVKRLPSVMDIYTTIGYVAKQSKTDISTNMPPQEIEAGRNALYHETKVPLAHLENVYEHKQLTKGNCLNYLYDAHIRNPEVPISILPEFMVRHDKLSFVQLARPTITTALKELVIITSKDANIHEKYQNDDKSLIYHQELTFPKNLDQMSKLDVALLLEKVLIENVKILKFCENHQIMSKSYILPDISDSEKEEYLISLK